MIHIPRPAAPAFLTDPQGKWVAKTQAAISWYGFGPLPARAFDFKHYNDERVKLALKQVFIKCAYCDNSYRGSSDGDVEHFRPKGRVQEKTPQNPGYYWLANDWDNLLLSCQHCNQNRRHVVVGEALRIGRGKLDQFPMRGNNGWVTSPAEQLTLEDGIRLLLNPCIDYPETHLSYDFANGLINSHTDEGKSSIEVYVLQREELVKDRKEVILQLSQIMSAVLGQLDIFNANPSPRNKAQLDLLIDLLTDFCEPRRIFAGMSRYFVRQFLRDNGLA
ncbi:hypothetical protein LLH06_08650 [Mucilaginibacter daejeonensis]|uniref:hypothetical protein n=1 Tax=Mucilaginibacter daejeonensis TaxID=398049 RepID=UPI001D171EE0|nr:hypothetical protein [Mucilaginibacter daejeonensis]UEG55032.1 hypothetical protein LLH06_08650 [Mucilaginibacter daejeonensis]